MGAVHSVIPDLEAVIEHGSPMKRAETLRRITALFVDGANQYNDEHVGLFDEVFGLLIREIETKALAELSRRLAPVGNAPTNLLRTLARADDIDVAGPVLKLARRLEDVDLVDVAATKSQAHLHAISWRPALGEAVTDVLAHRGDREVLRRIAANRNARISETGFCELIRRAEDDGILAEKVGLRPDVPPRLFRELLTKASAVVRRRLIASASPELRTAICDVLVKVTNELGARGVSRDYRAAQRLVLGLSQANELTESAVQAFCSEGKYEEAVVGLAALAKVPLAVVERLMEGNRPDPVLILCKALKLSWPMVKALILVRPDSGGTSRQALDEAFANFERLSEATAGRVVRFWQMQQNQ